MGSIENHVIVVHIVEIDEEYPIIHGLSLGEANYRVDIDKGIGRDADIPISVKGVIDKVSEAIGAHVAWPKDLAFFINPMVSLDYSKYLIHKFEKISIPSF